jgi:hypothetical protein
MMPLEPLTLVLWAPDAPGRGRGRIRLQDEPRARTVRWVTKRVGSGRAAGRRYYHIEIGAFEDG